MHGLRGILVSIAIKSSHVDWVAMETETKTQGVTACSDEYYNSDTFAVNISMFSH